MISSPTGTSLLNYLSAQSAGSTDGSSASASTGASAQARVAATAQAALQAAGGRPKVAAAAQLLDKQQTALASDLRSAMGKAGIKLNGAIEFSIGSDGKVGTKGSDADKAATTAFLKADTTRPSFATRIATQATDALKFSATLQQNAAISQAARYGGRSGGVMSLYTSLMQQPATTTAVFTLAAGSSSLTYPGSLAAKA